jgi:hypothetical protein
VDVTAALVVVVVVVTDRVVMVVLTDPAVLVAVKVWVSVEIVEEVVVPAGGTSPSL